MSMKSQPKQFPQVTQSSTGYQYGQNYNSSPAKQIGGQSDPEYAVEGQDRVPCSVCGRKFAPESIEKHERICQKAFGQKRKAFDAKEQRKAEGEKTTMTEFSKPFGLKKGNKRSS